MPGMDGVEFVSEVAQRKLACALVIASGLDANVLRAVEAIGESQGLQVLAALEKPLTARRLGEVLGQYTQLKDGDNRHDAGSVAVVDLRDALESGDLTAQFEPRIDLTTGAFSSAEAVFVPALARHHLLLPFIERLIAESCRLRHEAGDLRIRVAIDVSALPLSDPPLADALTEMVTSRNCEPRDFVMEVDDVTLARASAPALSVLTRLRVKGFGLAMTNCGAGPSWLHQLGRAPLSELRLDRRLVSGVSDDSKRMAALESALESIHESGLPVVADGCDSREDFDALLALGCSEAQGRYVRELMPGDDLIAWALAGGPK
jgi:EAL domain-containing protein (putative c-di-GMP-specific phosphodiesterase class I)